MEHQTQCFDSYNNPETVTRGVLRNFSKFIGKHLQACNFIEKETLEKVFSCEFYEISKNTFSAEHLQATASE